MWNHQFDVLKYEHLWTTFFKLKTNKISVKHIQETEK